MTELPLTAISMLVTHFDFEAIFTLFLKTNTQNYCTVPASSNNK